MNRSASVNTDLVAMFNRTLLDIIETNRNLHFLTDIRPYQVNIDYRNEALHQLMNHRPHQAEY